MKVTPTGRKFQVAMGIELTDAAHIELAPDEQVTFKAEGSEYDFCRKDWGYYASPSLNSRMGRYGLRPALVKSSLNGTVFLMAVLKDRQKDFEDYLAKTGQSLVMWLDDPSALSGLAAARRCLCGGGVFSPVFHYDAPPKGEVVFEFSKGAYSRDVVRCPACGHFLSLHAMDMSGMYGGQYVDATYGDKMAAAFKRIVGLPAKSSDNAGRVAYINAFLKKRGTVLDVGSGLCVFLHRMKKTGWRGTALDPDPRAARHAEKVVGVKALCADFMKAKPAGKFDLITFNKVLEHALDPVAMLKKAHGYLRPGGRVYVELPDGEAAAAGGPTREEFFIDHHHVFSSASYCILAEKAGFRVEALERLREPSSKYTLRGFLCPQ